MPAKNKKASNAIKDLLATKAAAKCILGNKHLVEGLPAAVLAGFKEDKKCLEEFAELIADNDHFHETYKQALLRDSELYKNFFEYAFRPENNSKEFFDAFTKPFLDDERIISKLSDELVKSCASLDQSYFSMEQNPDFLKKDVEQRITVLEKGLKEQEQVSCGLKTQTEYALASLKQLLTPDSNEYSLLRELILRDEKLNTEVNKAINKTVLRLLQERTLDYEYFQDLEELRKLNNIVFLAGRCGHDYAQRTGENFKKMLDTEFLGEQDGAEGAKKPRFIQEIYERIAEERFNFGYFKDGKFMPKQFIKYQQFIKDQNNIEIFVQLRTNVRGKDVHIFQLFNDPVRDLGELEELCGAVARAGASKISVYTPYPPFQRQDKKDDGRVEISAKKYFNNIKDACLGKLTRVFGFDFHNKAAQGHFDGPVDELTAVPYFALYCKNKFRRESLRSIIRSKNPEEFKEDLLHRFDQYYADFQRASHPLKLRPSASKDETFLALVDYCTYLKEGGEYPAGREKRVLELVLKDLYKKEIANCMDDIVVVAPDGGAGKRATELANLLSIPGQVVFGYKQRKGHSEVAEQYIAGDVSNKIAIICDDLIDSGGTILELAKKLKEKGAKEVYVCATHAELSPNVHRISKKIKEEIEKKMGLIKTSIRGLYDTVKTKAESMADSVSLSTEDIYKQACNAYTLTLPDELKQVIGSRSLSEKDIYSLACRMYVNTLPQELQYMFDSYPLADTEIASLAWHMYTALSREEKKKYQAEFLFWEAKTIPDPKLKTNILTKLITTDSVPPKHHRKYYAGCKEWMEVITTTYLTASVVLCNQLERSVSKRIDDFKEYIQKDDAKLTFIDLAMEY